MILPVDLTTLYLDFPLCIDCRTDLMFVFGPSACLLIFVYWIYPVHVDGLDGYSGQSLSNQRWMLSMEGQVVCEGAQLNFVSGLAALFASFYNFNLQYQEEAACSLEFVQRRFLDINPERGSKAKKGKVTSKKTGHVVQKKTKKKNSTVNPQVSSLLRKLADFEWNFV